MIIAINGRKSSYIPCIAWEKEANIVESLKVGDSIIIRGRMQSRNYKKRLEDGTVEKRTTYELSVMGIHKN